MGRLTKTHSLQSKNVQNLTKQVEQSKWLFVMAYIPYYTSPSVSGFWVLADRSLARDTVNKNKRAVKKM